VSIVGGSLRILIELLVMFFLLFYSFRDEAQGLSALRALLPLSKSETDVVFQLVSDTIHGTIYGTLMAALLQGALGGLMFWWLGLPSPLVWGIVMALLGVVPVLGPFIIWIPAAIVLALQGHWGKALILTAWGAVIIGLIDNIVYPVFVGKRMHFHTVPVFIALIGGLMLFGTAGLVVGPIVMATTVALLEVWRQRTTGGSTVEAGFGPPVAEADTFTARLHRPGQGEPPDAAQ
jgi:predicted PurR-regulated permease PerM